MSAVGVSQKNYTTKELVKPSGGNRKGRKRFGVIFDNTGPIIFILFFFFFFDREILESASRATFPVSLSNVGFTPRLLYSSTLHSLTGFIHLKNG